MPVCSWGLGFLMLASGCGDEKAGAQDITLEAPAQGFQLRAGPFPLISGAEVQDCYYFKVPITAPMNVHRIEVNMNPGSHHMNLFRLTGQSGHYDGEVERGCWDAVAFEQWGLMFNTQNSGLRDWTLPDGVYQHLEPNDLLMLQTHYVNASTQASVLGRGKVMVNFYEAGPGQDQFELGAMFANNRAISLPPHQRSSFTTTCVVPQDVRFVSIAGHFHSRGLSFEIGTVNDGQGAGFEQVYRSMTWDDPPLGLFSPGKFVPSGGGLQYTCTFFNNTDQTIKFGPQVEFDEHCNVFAYYYPALPSRRPIYCF